MLIHNKSNKVTYCDLQRNHKLFTLHIIYGMNARIWHCLCEARQRNFDWNPLDLSRISKETIHNRIFKVNLPPYIYNSKSRRNTEDHMSNKRTKRDTVRNRKLNQSGKSVLAKDTLKCTTPVYSTYLVATTYPSAVKYRSQVLVKVIVPTIRTKLNNILHCTHHFPPSSQNADMEKK